MKEVSVTVKKRNGLYWIEKNKEENNLNTWFINKKALNLYLQKENLNSTIV